MIQILQTSLKSRSPSKWYFLSSFFPFIHYLANFNWNYTAYSLKLMFLRSNINSYNLETRFLVTSSQTPHLANEMRLWCGMQPGEHLRRAGCILGSRRRALSLDRRPVCAEIGAKKRERFDKGFANMSWKRVYRKCILCKCARRQRACPSWVKYTTYNIRLRCSYELLFQHSLLYPALCMVVLCGSGGEEIRGPAAGSVCLYLIFERLLLLASREREERDVASERITRFVFCQFFPAMIREENGRSKLLGLCFI